MTVFLIPALALAAPIGTLIDRRGVRAPAQVGFTVLIVGAALAAAAPNFPLLLASRVLAGAGAALLLVTALRRLAAEVPAHQLGAAFGVFVAGLPVGTVAAFDVITPLVGQRHWRPAAAASALVVVIFFAGFLLATRHPIRHTSATPPRPEQTARVRLPASAELRRLLILVVLGYTTIIAFTTWAPSQVSKYAHLGGETTTILASILLAIDIPFAPAWGRLSDHLGRRKPFVIAAFATYGTGALILVGAAHSGGSRTLWVALTIAFMGVGCAMFFPTTLAIATHLFGPDGLGAGYGLFVTAQVLGMAVGPLALGPVFTQVSPLAGVLTVAGLSFLAVPLSARLPGR